MSLFRRKRVHLAPTSGVLRNFIVPLVWCFALLVGCTDSNDGQDGDSAAWEDQETTNQDVTVSDSSSSTTHTTDTGDAADTAETDTQTISSDNGDTQSGGPNDSDSDHADADCPSNFDSYEVAQAGHAITGAGCQGAITVNKDEVDLFIPLASGRFPVLIVMQGAKVEKSHYSQYAKYVSSYGVIVAIPNHSSIMGKYFTEQKVFNNVWETLQSENELSESVLFDKVDTENVGVIGHSFAGTISSNLVQNKCEFPSCTGNLKAPEELGAALFYGFNNVNPLTGVASPTNNLAPVMYIAGELNDPQKTEKTYNKTQNSPKFFVEVMGANHYGVTNTDNPEGANPDTSVPTVEQDVATRAIADWSGVFIRAYLHEDEGALEYLVHLGDEADERVVVKGEE